MVRNIDLNFPPVESIQYSEPENTYRDCQQQVSYVPPSSATNIELTENEVVVLSSSGSLPMVIPSAVTVELLGYYCLWMIRMFDELWRFFSHFIV